MNIGVSYITHYLFILSLLMVLTLCSTNEITRPFQANEDNIPYHPYGLKDTPKTLRQAKAGGPYSLASMVEEEKLKSITKNRYGLITPMGEQGGQIGNPYLLESSNQKSSKLTKNRYNLYTPIKEKQIGNPYSLESSDQKSSKLTENRYNLYTPVEEKEIKSKGAYGLKPKDRLQTQESILLPYFNYLSDKEELELAPYIYKSREEDIDKIDYLSLYKNYKKPKIRAFIMANQSYDDDKYNLKYPKNDLLAYKKLLNIILETPLERIYTTENISLNSFKSEFSQFIKTIKPDEFVMIIYSGHSNNNGMPIFTDMKSISSKDFYDLVNSFANDTVIIMDSSYIGNTQQNFIRIAEDGGMKENVLRFYSNLVSKDIKEGIYKDKYNRYLQRSYRLLDQIKANKKGNGLFTILFISFFADFSFSKSQMEVRFETVSSYINSKISAFQEGGIYIHRPKMLPIIGSKFKEEKNNYILFNTLLQRQLLLAREDQILKAMYNKAIRLQNQGKYESAVSMFLGVVRRGGTKYKNINNRLSECYFALEKEGNSLEEKINFYRKGLKYIAGSDKSLDNLADKYDGLAKKSYNERNVTQSIYYQQQAIAIYTKTKDNVKLNTAKNNLEKYIDSQNAQDHLRIGYNQYNKLSYDKAIYHFNKALIIYEKYNDDFNKAICFNNLGAVYNVKKSYNKALKYHNRSIKIKIKIKDIEGTANTYNNIGVIYYNIKNYNKAIRYLRLALINYRKLNITDLFVAKCYDDIINSYHKVNNKRQAYLYKREKNIVIKS